MSKAKIIVPLVIIILFAGAGVYWWVYTQSEGYQAEKFVKEWEERYRQDTVGGSTPEETLQLFIEALKRGDVELAAKYFLLDKQDQWREDLSQIEERGLLSEMAKDLERPKDKRPISEGREDRYYYYIYNDQNQLSVVIDVIQLPNGIWKIADL